MLYFTLPQDVRERYENSEWLVYQKQIEETTFTPEDIVVFWTWLVPDAGERMTLLHRIRRQGARVIYVGPKTEDTDEFKRRLCFLQIYDFLFIDHEIVLAALDRLIEQPRTASDVREYLSEEERQGLGEAPNVVDVVDSEGTSTENTEEGDKEPHPQGRKRRGWMRRRNETVEPVIQLIQPRLIAVVGLWPRSGVSTTAQLIAKLFVDRMPPNTVSLVEHPNQWPRMWEYFQLDEHRAVGNYVHWTEDGVGMTIDVDGVSLVPLPPGDNKPARGAEAKMMPYLMRQLRRPITVLDCGQNVKEDMLFGMVDRLVCVVDCDPTYLAVDELGKRYESLVTKYGGRMMTVLNKWTRYAAYEDLFEDAIRVPYLPPEDVQKALWEGAFVDLDEDRLEDLEALQEALVEPLLPKNRRD